MFEPYDDDIEDLGDSFFELCNDTQFDGLDRHAAKTWIYPTNLPLRKYQFDIVETALSHNTLVSLPTGLGKTMIAAVVMYNMYRWYPMGKIIFMAPTRPLVAQQADACRNITCLPHEHTAQLTGDVNSGTRSPIWEKTRVFFITPQILQRDLQTNKCPAHLIRCLVFDEAHRARKNHAYCEVMRLLGNHASRVRVLALSATPGANSSQVAEVARVLRIARLEVRTENCEDVKPFVFSKSMETVVVPLGEPLTTIKEKYIQILDQYTRRLMKSGVLSGSAGNINKGRIFMVQKDYKATCQRQGRKPDSYVLQDLTFCLTLYHAYEVLIKHGLRGFLSYYEDHGEAKAWVRKDNQLSTLLSNIKNHLGDDVLNVSYLPDGTIPEVSENFVFGHPKYTYLRDIVKKHFADQPDTRVMVFCEYRNSVQEAFGALLQCRPLVRPRMFLGQAAISQKQQLSIMRKFREGACNTLICTCVAEEGLDVAAVQLIICFDIANRSPVRLAQRIGRTGRHQVGRIVMLVTEGQEQQTLAETLKQSNLLDKRLLQSPEVRASMLVAGPAMIPDDIQSECHRLHMTPADKSEKKLEFNKKDKQPGIRKYNSTTTEDDVNHPVPAFDKIPIGNQLCLSKLTADEFHREPSSKINQQFSSTSFQKNVHSEILPSSNSEILKELFKKCEDLRFNLPVRNTSGNPVPVKTKNRDIREMFVKSQQQSQNVADIFEIPSSHSPKKSASQLAVSTKTDKMSFKRSTFLLNLHSELSVRASVNLLDQPECTVCKNLFNCQVITDLTKMENKPSTTWSEPDEIILKSLTYENLRNLNITDLLPYTSPHRTKKRDSFNFESFNREQTFEKLRQNYDSNTSINYNNDSFVPILTLSTKSPAQNQYTSQREHLESNNKLYLDGTLENEIFNHEFRTPTPRKSNKTLSSQNNVSVREHTPKCSSVKKFLRTASHLDISEYVPDEISRATLNFFRLSSIEDLFTRENLITHSSQIPNVNTPLKWPHNQLEHKVNKNADTQRTLNKNYNAFNSGNVGKSNLISNYFSQNQTKKQNALDFEPFEENDEIIDLCSPISQEFKAPQRVSEEIGKLNKSCSSKYVGLAKVNESVVDYVLYDESLFLNNSGDEEEIVDQTANNSLKTVQNDFASKTNNSEENDNHLERSVFYDDIWNEPLSPVLSSQRKTTSHSEISTDNHSHQFTKDISPVMSSQTKNMFSKETNKNNSLSCDIDDMSPVLSSQRKNTSLSETSTHNHSRKFSTDLSPVMSSQKSQTKNIFSKEANQNNSLFCDIDDMSSKSKVNEKKVYDCDYLSEDELFADETYISESIQNPSTVIAAVDNVPTSNNLPLKSTASKEDASNFSVQKSSCKLPEHFKLPLNSKLTLKPTSVTFKKTNSDDSIRYLSPIKPLCASNNRRNNIFKSPETNSKLQLPNTTVQFGRYTNIKLDASRFNDSDSEDASLCDFARPVRKRLRKTFQPIDSSNDNISLSEPTKSPNRPSVDFLSQFKFQKNKSRVGEGNVNLSRTYNEDQTPRRRERTNHVKKKRKLKSDFIEYEAMVSGDDDSTDHIDSDNDVFDDSFVVDNNICTQNANVDMQAHYLQSVKSPKKNIGNFKIPSLPDIDVNELYSQFDSEEENTYINDSFCADTIVNNEELSVLEIAEKELARQRKNIKDKRANPSSRRVHTHSDSSEDEEMAAFRRICLNNLTQKNQL